MGDCRTMPLNISSTRTGSLLHCTMVPKNASGPSSPLGSAFALIVRMFCAASRLSSASGHAQLFAEHVAPLFSFLKLFPKFWFVSFKGCHHIILRH